MVLEGWGYWWKGALLGVAYSISYLLMWALSADQLYFPAGLRLAALLMFPPRWWPFLVAGEAAALLHLRIPQVNDYGLLFVVISSITIMPFVAGILKTLPKRISSAEDAFWFLPLAASVPVFTTAANTFLTFVVMKEVRAGVDWTNTIVIMVGAYLGILTVAPLALVWKYRNNEFPFPRPLARDACIALAANALLGAFVLLVPDEFSDARNILRVSMVLPAVVLTLVHGWRGAAIGVAIANVAIGITIHHTLSLGSHDPISFSAQLVMAIASSTLLIAGSTVTRYYEQARQHGLDKYQSLLFARTSFAVNEQEIRHRLSKIGNVGDDVYASLIQVSHRLKQRGHHAAALEVQTAAVDKARLYKEQMHIIYPDEVETHGLYHALESSPLAEAWHDLCVIKYDLKGNSEHISSDLQLMAYRVISDIMSTLITTGHREIIISARTWNLTNYTGLAIKIAIPAGEEFNSYVQKIENFDVTGRVKACGGKIRRRKRYIWFSMIEPSAYRSILQRTPGFSTDQVTKPSGAV